MGTLASSQFNKAQYFEFPPVIEPDFQKLLLTDLLITREGQDLS
jgi:hypothetical protein